MPALPSWLLPVILFAVWGLWGLTCAVEHTARELRRGTPKEKHGRVSVFPGVPIFPLCFWGAAALIDSAFLPWGSIMIGAFHLLMAAMMIYTLIRDIRYLRLHGSP